MDSESKTHATSNDSEVKFPDTKDSEESGKVQSNSSEDPSLSRNTDNCSVTSESSVILKDASYTVGSDSNLACGTNQNEQVNEPMELSAEDEIKITNSKCDKTNDVLKEILYATSFNSVDLSEATTSQDNSPSSSYTNEPNALHVDQNKVKRSISKGQVHGSGTSIEKSDDSSDEDSSKRQKLNKSARNTSAGNVNDDTVTFQRNKSKVKQRNYRKRRNVTSDNEDSSSNTLPSEVTREAPIPDADEGNVASVSTKNDSTQNESSNVSSGACRARSETPNDESDRYKDERADSNEWRAANEDEWDENEDIYYSLNIEKAPPNWHIVPELVNRQIGSNPLFQSRLCGSSYTREQQLMYNLLEHSGCSNTLNLTRRNVFLWRGCWGQTDYFPIPSSGHSDFLFEQIEMSRRETNNEDGIESSDDQDEHEYNSWDNDGSRDDNN